MDVQRYASSSMGNEVDLFVDEEALDERKLSSDSNALGDDMDDVDEFTPAQIAPRRHAEPVPWSASTTARLKISEDIVSVVLAIVKLCAFHARRSYRSPIWCDLTSRCCEKKLSQQQS